jgi:hypothetical protein
MKLTRAILAVLLFLAGFTLWNVAESSLDTYMTAKHQRTIELMGE